MVEQKWKTAIRNSVIVVAVLIILGAVVPPLFPQLNWGHVIEDTSSIVAVVVIIWIIFRKKPDVKK